MREQAGVVTHRQWLNSGGTHAQWRWRLQRGQWRLLLPGIALTQPGPQTPLQFQWAAVLWGGEGACLAGDSAMVAAGVRQLSTNGLDLLVPASRGSLAPRGIRVHRYQVAPPVCGAPPRLRLPRATLLAAAWAGSDRAAELRLALPVQQLLVRPDELANELAKVGLVKRRPLIRAVLADLQHGAHTLAEMELLRLLRRQQLPLPDAMQQRVRADGLRYLDAWWAGPGLVVEVDGAHHREAGSWESDLSRANAVQLRPEVRRLLRFTNGQVRGEQAAVGKQIRAALAAERVVR